MPMTAAADDASDGNNAASMPTVLSASQARAAVAGSGLTPAWLNSPARQSAETQRLALNAEPSPTATPPEEEPPTLPPTLGDYGLAAWRACFYVLMYFHWRNSEVHALPAYEPKMFGYDQFWWVPQLMPQDPAAVEACRELGGRLALLAAAGVAFPLSSGVYTLMAARHLFASITHFTNHNYLFVLLSLLTSCSGAGRTLSFDALLGPLTGGWLSRAAPATADEPPYRGGAYRGATWVVLLLRLQLAVVYLFAFVWKLHPDWVSGQCCRLTFLSFEEQAATTCALGCDHMCPKLRPYVP
jgi:hypothetical protein